MRITGVILILLVTCAATGSEPGRTPPQADRSPQLFYFELHTFYRNDFQTANLDFSTQIEVGRSFTLNIREGKWRWSLHGIVTEINSTYMFKTKLELFDIDLGKVVSSHGGNHPAHLLDKDSPGRSTRAVYRFSDTDIGDELFCFLQKQDDADSYLIERLSVFDDSFVEACTRLSWKGSFDKGIVPSLVKALDYTPPPKSERNPRLNFILPAAIQALGRIGPISKEAIPRLIELTTSKDELVRQHAAMAISKIGGLSSSDYDNLQNIRSQSKDNRVNHYIDSALHNSRDKETRP